MRWKIACGTVRGYPSRMNPCRQSRLLSRLTTSALTNSSSTRPPVARTVRAVSPSSVSARHSARSISPVEMAGILRRSEINRDWVPLPEPGAPNSSTTKHPPIWKKSGCHLSREYPAELPWPVVKASFRLSDLRSWVKGIRHLPGGAVLAFLLIVRDETVGVAFLPVVDGPHGRRSPPYPEPICIRALACLLNPHLCGGIGP